MDQLKNDVPKLPDMVMCGDHPSFTKTEPSVKGNKVNPKEQDRSKERASLTFAKLTPTTSRTGAIEQRARTTSDHTLRLLEARRRIRSCEVARSPDVDIAAPGNKALVQAALGSFQWPPYLLAVWVFVLLLTHILHCLINLLEHSLPAIKKLCQYFRGWTEDLWKVEPSSHRVYPLGLACLTGLLYILYFGLYALYSVALWAIEPLCVEEEKRSLIDEADAEAKVTDYEEICTNASPTGKQLHIQQ